ncbi:MAG: DUF3800 domain-containing protein [Bacillota bacterium]|nr:DUF3800 domain-containing protein [Bacillota bacterium]
MNLFVYSDESGVFDSIHNDYFVFGGLMFLCKEDRDDAIRRYHHVEQTIRNSGNYSKGIELKASVLNNSEKGKIMRSLNGDLKFAVIVEQKKLNENIFYNKKHKQRYLDYLYKIGLKKFLQYLASQGTIDLESIERIYVNCDEHTTATSGRYELEEALLREFKDGTFNQNYQHFFPPCTQNLKELTVSFCASEKKPLIRAADIIANHVYSCTVRSIPVTKQKLFILRQP